MMGTSARAEDQLGICRVCSPIRPPPRSRQLSKKTLFWGLCSRRIGEIVRPRKPLRIDAGLSASAAAAGGSFEGSDFQPQLG
jgi:hypothetical protein